MRNYSVYAIKTFVITLLLFTATDLFGQSFVIGEPQGILDRVITHYEQTEQIGDSVIIDVQIIKFGDTTIFCITKLFHAAEIFMCPPGAIYKKGGNYVFIHNGYESYFCGNEDYIKYIYSLAAKFTRLNIRIKSYSPFDMEFTDPLTVGGDVDVSEYRYYWYYVLNNEILKAGKSPINFYPICQINCRRR